MIINKKPIEYEINENGCHICTSHYRDKDNYPKICVNGRQKSMSRHLYEIEYGVIPFGKVVRHTCDNSMCINVKHLILGTQQENINDKVLRGRQAKGEKIGVSKLTRLEIISIRNDKSTNSSIAKDYGVASSTIDRIKNYKTWKEVV